MIGITESGDASFDYSWVTAIETQEVTHAVLITKCVTNEFIQQVIKYQEKLILHVTCTGNEKIFEPNSPTAEWTCSQVQKLIAQGFNPERIVLRIDPIIPTTGKGAVIKNILKLFASTGIKRVRFSFIDLYEHVKARFASKGITTPWNSFNVPSNIAERYIALFKEFSHIYQFECCAESYDCIPKEWKIGCISLEEVIAFGIQANIKLKGQRKTCLCIAEKKEILKENKKGTKCPMQCLYCYWR